MSNKIDIIEVQLVFISLRVFAFISTKPFNFLENQGFHVICEAMRKRVFGNIGNWEIVKSPWHLWWRICLLGMGDGSAALETKLIALQRFKHG